MKITFLQVYFSRLLVLGSLLLLIVSCTVNPVTPAVIQTTTATVALQSTIAPTLPMTATPQGPNQLRIWLPPMLDPKEDTPAGKLLRARLDEFSARRPGVEIEIRIKAQEGPGGLYDSLATASAAAPATLPDLVALPRGTLEDAVQKGLLHTYDNLTAIMEDTDWYDYARQLARVQNTTFGIPFAADFLVLGYHTEHINAPPRDIDATISTGDVLLFPAADPQALFTLLLYESAGGSLTDEQGKPNLDQQVLLQFLSNYQKAQKNAVMPYWLTQYQTYSQIWQAFTEDRSDLAIIWFSDYLNNQLDNAKIAPIPTIGGSPITLTTGWIWAFAGPEDKNISLTVELADYLSSDSFVADWASAINLIPTRQSSMNFWQNSEIRAIANQIANSGIVFPASDVLSVIEPPVYEATTQVLKDQVDPAKAAQQALDNLKNP
jgi:multiple sugar transport system substrate-binding protein